MADWHSMRASDADRERAADLLKAAMAEGRLSWDEYQQRLGTLMASKSYGELHRVVDDLPSGLSPFATPPGPPANPPAGGPAHPAPLQPPVHPAVPPPPHSNDPLATTAMVLGAMVPFTAGMTAIPAIIVGHLALSKINRNGDTSGRGMAIAGLVLGYLPVAVALFVFVVVFGFGFA